MNCTRIEHLTKWVEEHRREPEVVAKEKLTRIMNTIELKTPDRVPLLAPSGDFMITQTGLTWYELSYELTPKVKNAVLKYTLEYPSDFGLIFVPYLLEGFILAVAFSDFPDFSNLIRFISGPLHDVLRDKWSKWPGRELGEHLHPQFVGGTFMEPNEYKKLAENPVEFIHNVILPRACPGLGTPGTTHWNGTLIRAGIAVQRTISFMVETLSQLKWYPLIPLTNAYVPADLIGDFLRHPTGAMVDIRRYPDDFKASCDALMNAILGVATAIPTMQPLTLFFIPLHLNEMLPPRLYVEFYWPYLKKIIETLVSKGYKGFVFFEGDHSPHVDTILELPKGWGVAWFERPRDFVKNVWDKLKGHTAVAGGIPPSLFYQSPEKVEEYVKNVLQMIKPEGGFMIAPGVAELPADVNPASVKAYINAVLKYGSY
ncbi:MAG: uroporphyrinogen decarboxylase family protein [Desulfurococcaceae archaeon]